DGYLVDDLRRVRQRLGYPRPRLPMLREFELRSVQARVRPDERVIEVFDELLRDGLAVVFGERRLVIEGLELRRPAGHKQINHALRLRFKMRLLWRQRLFYRGF